MEPLLSNGFLQLREKFCFFVDFFTPSLIVYFDDCWFPWSFDLWLWRIWDFLLLCGSWFLRYTLYASTIHLERIHHSDTTIVRLRLRPITQSRLELINHMKFISNTITMNSKTKRQSNNNKESYAQHCIGYQPSPSIIWLSICHPPLYYWKEYA